MDPAEFDYALPDELIARYPSPERAASRLLVVGDEPEPLADRRFSGLPDALRPGDLLIGNDTRVLAARLHGRKETGGRLELLIERVTGTVAALAQIRASHALKPGARFTVTPRQAGSAPIRATVVGRDGRFFAIEFDRPVGTVLDAAGHVPLPPYIDRADELSDRERYQTVYAREPGAVAAPTAGLHFDTPLLAALDEAGIGLDFITLHVGAGTFQPLSDEQLRSGRLHAERFVVSAALCDRIRATRSAGGRIVAVGTTVVRALEAAAAGGELTPTDGETDIFIRPGYRFGIVDGMITNFHLPRSSLMMLVSAFAGRERILAAYRHAVAGRYRFFSYGDAMLLWPPAGGA
jgi:S-adenosylmethionine:tRNA ribosyltransferase-isomerase